MRNTSSVSSRGIGLSGVLTIVFIVLKLLKVIKWSWAWVLSPLWISFSLWLVLVVIIFGVIKIS